jgi:hypothetical protein
MALYMLSQTCYYCILLLDYQCIIFLCLTIIRVIIIMQKRQAHFAIT